MTGAHAPTTDRLMRRVKIVGDCWEWQGYRARQGYGRLKYEGRMEPAHRVAYREFVGPIPAGLHVLHACDNPPCINPDHLSVGTHAENMRQMAERGRSTRGETAPSALLTADDVREIRGRYRPRKVTQADLANEFGVSVTAIYRALHGMTWADVA